MNGHQELVGFIWSIAELLRGDYRQSEYGRIILPFTVLRRLDCVMEASRDKVFAAEKKLPKGIDPVMRDRLLQKAAGLSFYNLSEYNFSRLRADTADLAPNIKNYVSKFSKTIRDMFGQHFEFPVWLDDLDRKNLLFQVFERFANIDLHPVRIDNVAMGYAFEELIRRFSEQSNETAGEHFTPREVIRLMVGLLFEEDRDALSKPGQIRTLYDPACGTGGMLSVAEEYVRHLNPSTKLQVYGQELNGESYAICQADMLIKGADASTIAFGNSFTQDGMAGKTFDYMLSNPPFGVDWKKIEKEVRAEADKGANGRFGPGLPRVSDGSLLFLLHMISKFKTNAESRLAIVFNGSPMFTGEAGSGESEIRRHVIENDMLEAIVALPDQLFYNTGISTYVWVVTNQKKPQRKGKVQLISATGEAFWRKMRRSLGDKRKEIAEDHIGQIVRTFGTCTDSEISKVFPNSAFGYKRITVERPLRLAFAVTAERIAGVKVSTAFENLARTKKKGKDGAAEIAEGTALQCAIMAVLDASVTKKTWNDRAVFEPWLKTVFKKAGVIVPANVFKAVMIALSERDETAAICRDAKGTPEPDPDLRDNENVPLEEEIAVYVAREVLPHVPDAWIDESKTKIGYEIPFTRHFYVYTPPRPLKEIDAELRILGTEIQKLLGEVMA